MAAPRSSPSAASITTKIKHIARFVHQCRGVRGEWGSGEAEVGDHTSLGDFFITQKPLVSLQGAKNQTLYSLLTSDMLDIPSNSIIKSSCTLSGTSGAGTRKW